MKKRQIITGMAATLVSALLFQPCAVAGTVTITNNYCDVIVVGTDYSTGSGSSATVSNSKTTVRKDETRKDSSPIMGRISRILVVNTSDGANPDKASLFAQGYPDSGLATDFVVVVDADGKVHVTSENRFNGL